MQKLFVCLLLKYFYFNKIKVTHIIYDPLIHNVWSPDHVGLQDVELSRSPKST